MKMLKNARDREMYTVIHPLKDAPDEKCDPRSVGPMPLRGSTRLALLALRGYLLVMALLVLYHVLDLAGVFRR